MNFKTFIEKTINKIEWLVINPLLAGLRRKRLLTTNFTIISNNCWGGVCYEYFGLQKLTPTVGAYFYASDYVRFCKNLKYYLSQDLIVVNACESIHFDDLVRKKEDDVFVGKLADVEIIFLHYNSKEVIIEKWHRRIKRINWDNIILKFSYQNECSDDLVNEFLSIKEYQKFVLVGKKNTDSDDEIEYKRCRGKETVDETQNFNKYVKVIPLINNRTKHY